MGVVRILRRTTWATGRRGLLNGISAMSVRTVIGWRTREREEEERRHELSRRAGGRASTLEQRERHYKAVAPVGGWRAPPGERLNASRRPAGFPTGGMGAGPHAKQEPSHEASCDTSPRRAPRSGAIAGKASLSDRSTHEGATPPPAKPPLRAPEPRDRPAVGMTLGRQSVLTRIVLSRRSRGV